MLQTLFLCSVEVIANMVNPDCFSLRLKDIAWNTLEPAFILVTLIRISLEQYSLEGHQLT